MSWKPYHLNYFHLSLNAQMIEKGCQVLLHLDGVILHLGHCEDSHSALAPNLRREYQGKAIRGAAAQQRRLKASAHQENLHLMLSQQEGQQHQHPPIVHNPPDVDVAVSAWLAVAGEQGDVFGDQQCKMGRCSHSHRVWEGERGRR